LEAISPSKSHYGSFFHWWAALPAVPPSKQGMDWWVTDPFGRCTPYDRLKRVWFDPTWFPAPKEDPLRPHAFAKPTHGTHLSCKSWESFVLFHPSEWIPALLSAAGVSCQIAPVDCSWSYEFEAKVGDSKNFKLVDIAMHVRGKEGSELLLVIEVKRPGDKLKEDVALPDTNPSSYLDREAFHSVPDRRLIYLVDDSYAPVVRSKVPKSERWGIITWSQLCDIQISLAQATFPDPLRRFLSMILISQYLEAKITGLRHSPDTFSGSEGFLIDGSTQRWRKTIDAAGSMPEYLSNFVRGSLQYLECLGGVRPATLAFPYLVAEPSFEDIHNLPKHLRQTTPDRRRTLWKLPPQL
jgi:predicted DNA-binding protein (MmcQ/YjbR family)